MLSKFKRNIKLEYIQHTIRSFNLTGVIWLIYLYEKGFSALDIGVFESLFHVSSLSVEIPSGMIADLIGRKNARIFGVFLYLAYLLLMLITKDFIFIAIAFILCGASYAFESGSGEALVYDSLVQLNEQERYIRINGNKEIIFQVSSTIAFILGGYLALIDHELTFLLMVIGFVVLLIPIFLMEENLEKRQKKESHFGRLMYEHFIKSTKTVFSNKKVAYLIILGALLNAPVTALFFYFQLYLKISLGFNEFWIGVILALHAIGGALGGVVVYKLEKKFKEKLLLYIVPFFMVVSFWSIQLNFIVFLPFTILGFFDSIVYIVMNDYVNRLIPSEQRATILSFSGFSFSVIMIILFPVMGSLAELYGYQYSFLMVSIFFTIVVFLISYVLHITKIDINLEKKNN